MCVQPDRFKNRFLNVKLVQASLIRNSSFLSRWKFYYPFSTLKLYIEFMDKFYDFVLLIYVPKFHHIVTAVLFLDSWPFFIIVCIQNGDDHSY